MLGFLHLLSTLRIVRIEGRWERATEDFFSSLLEFRGRLY
jgi:hypothetical protein